MDSPLRIEKKKKRDHSGGNYVSSKTFSKKITFKLTKEIVRQVLRIRGLISLVYLFTQETIGTASDFKIFKKLLSLCMGQRNKSFRDLFF